MKGKWRWMAAIAAALALGGLLTRRDLPPVIPAKAGIASSEEPRATAAASRVMPSPTRTAVDDATPPDRIDHAFQQCERDYQKVVRARVGELAAGTPRDRIAAAL